MVNIFYTDKGEKIEAVTTAQMREVDRIAVEETGPNLFQMMENAGRNLALTIIKFLGSNFNDSSIIVLAGTGGNGGGGICAARHLINRNVNVNIVLTNQSAMRDVPDYQLEIFKKAGGVISDIKNIDSQKNDLIIDAMIGYNLKQAPRGNILELIKWANDQSVPKIALDIPSGIDATTGKNYGEYVNTNTTLTLALPKTGLTETKCGQLFLGDIGIPKIVYDKAGIEYHSPFDDRFIVPLKYEI